MGTFCYVITGNGKSQGALHGVERIAFQNGERLFDVSRTGAERPWRKKKISSLQLADIYDQFNPKKADRLRRCAQILAFVEKQMERAAVGKWNVLSCRPLPYVPMAESSKSLLSDVADF